MIAPLVAWLRALLSPRRCSRCLICLSTIAAYGLRAEACPRCHHHPAAHQPRRGRW